MESANEALKFKQMFKKYDIAIFYIIALTITWVGWSIMDAAITALGGDLADFDQLFYEGHYYLILWPVLSITAV